MAAERDRLKDIKNEMARRREFDGSSEKNLKQQQQQQLQQTHQIHPQPSTSAVQKEQILDSHFLQKKNDVEKQISHESPRVNKEPLQSADGLLYSPNNWSNRQNASSTPSLRSSHGGCNQSDKPIPNNSNQCKDSTDSGAVDMLNMSIEAGSMQSCSSRGYSVPPPMRQISGREGKLFIQFFSYSHHDKFSLISTHFYFSLKLKSHIHQHLHGANHHKKFHEFHR